MHTNHSVGAPEVKAEVLKPSSGFLVPLSTGQSLEGWLKVLIKR